jgi:hypothetical protein
MSGRMPFAQTILDMVLAEVNPRTEPLSNNVIVKAFHHLQGHSYFR